MIAERTCRNYKIGRLMHKRILYVLCLVLQSLFFAALAAPQASSPQTRFRCPIYRWGFGTKLSGLGTHMVVRSNGWIEGSPKSVRSAAARFERAMTAYYVMITG
jgi:hypothetical protein